MISVLVHEQNNLENWIKGTWHISMMGVNLDDTTMYQIQKEGTTLTI